MEALDWLWIAAAALVGAAVGSFLNVVMYRLPRNLSVSTPKRSFCPACGQPIAAYDNIPVASFLWLRGQCRQCGRGISLRYPVVEALTVLLFVLVVDTFWIAGVRGGAGTQSGWPTVAAHLVLVACLLAISGIDIEEYMVDLRLTWLLAFTGCFSRLLASTASEESSTEPWPATAGVAFAATVGLGVARLAWTPTGHDMPFEMQEATTAPNQPRSRKGLATGRSVVVWILLAVLVVAIAFMSLDASIGSGVEGWEGSFGWRAGLIVICCFGAVVGASAIKRESDDEIIGAIEDERPIARRVVLAELRFLAPAIVLAVGAGLALRIPAVNQAWISALAWAPAESHQPIQGLAKALAGFIIGGAVGWGVRIGFTLVLGREAFGLGDVHIMAAAGAVTGWFVVTVGFFLGAVLAVLGVLCLLVVKRSRAIPFGPWLSMGILVGVITYEPIYAWLSTGLQGLRLAIRGAESF